MLSFPTRTYVVTLIANWIEEQIDHGNTDPIDETDETSLLLLQTN